MFGRPFRLGHRRDAAPAPVAPSAPAMTDPQHRVDKAARLMKKSGSVRDRDRDRDPQRVAMLQRSFTGGGEEASSRMRLDYAGGQKSLAPPSPIITLTVGREGRLFAAHEDVLCQSPHFAAMIRGGALDVSMSGSGAGAGAHRRIALPEEEPEVFSAVLEYLYKGDYYPRLLHSKQRGEWELEDSLVPPPLATASTSHRGTTNMLLTPQASPALRSDASPNPNYAAVGGRSPHTVGGSSPHLTAGGASASPRVPTAVEATVYLSSIGCHILRDTVIYCAAERYGLGELQRLALRKQGLQAGIDVATILRSAQYAYAHTPDSDSSLRAHYLALIIRCRKTFKRSGTMQAEMERCGGDAYGPGGGKLFFDLFVAMCNHLDDVIDVGNARSPKMV